jgi:hypothetical protein
MRFLRRSRRTSELLSALRMNTNTEALDPGFPGLARATQMLERGLKSCMERRDRLVRDLSEDALSVIEYRVQRDALLRPKNAVHLLRQLEKQATS